VRYHLLLFSGMYVFIMYVYVFIYVCMYACMYVCMHACAPVRTHVCSFINVIRMLSAYFARPQLLTTDLNKKKVAL
jgi:hypothetical protein